MLVAARAVLFAAGIALVVAATFLHEREQQKIQDWLEACWITLDEYRSKALEVERRSAAWLADALSNVLDLLFGSKLLSLRVVVASMILTCCGLALLLLFATVPDWSTTPEWERAGDVHLIILACIVAGGLIVVAKISTRVTFAICCLMVAALAGRIWWWSGIIQACGFLLSVCLMISANLLFVASLRWLLRRRSFLLTTGLTLMLLSGILAAGLWMQLDRAEDVADKFLFSGTVWSISAIWLIGFSVSDILFLTFLLIVSTLIIVHHALWPTIQRPVYALQREVMLKHRRASCYAGLVLIGTGVALGMKNVTLWQAVQKIVSK